MRGHGRVKQDKLVSRRRRRLFYLCFYAVAAAGLLLSALSYISSLDALSISDIVVTGNSRLSASTIRSVALDDLGGTYGYFFSRGNALIYPRGQIRRDILALPIVRTATVGRSSMRTLALQVTERETSALWCAGASQSSDCYAIDESGFIFDKKNVADAGFIYRSAVAGEPIGQSVAASADFKKIQFFLTELGKLGVEPREADLEASSTYMTVRLGAGARLIINSADDLSTVLGNISAILSDKAVVPSLDAFLGKLDYMKLDVGNKVVFKLR